MTPITWALLVCTFAAATDEKPIEKDVVYGKAAGVALQLDLCRPAGDGPFPAVVCLHGGAWQLGNRSAHHRTIRLLADAGYVGVTVSYRLAPRYRWPAQLHDAKAAVRYLRARSKELKIDPDRIAAMGDSAGGHLALLLGLTDLKDGLEGTGGNATESSKIQAVVNYYGPTDLRVWSATEVGEAMFRVATKGKKGGDDILRDFAGTADRKAKVIEQLSPVSYLDKDDPPVLTFQGTDDPLVQLPQAKLLHKALEKAGVVQQLEVLEGKGHGWSGKDRDRTDKLMLDFLAKHLRKK